MNKTRFLITFSLTLGLSGYVFATCTSGSDPCNTPGTASITGFTATTLTMSAENSSGSPNTSDSVYFCEATTQGSPQNSGTADDKTVIVLTEDFHNPAESTDDISDTVKPLLA